VQLVAKYVVALQTSELNEILRTRKPIYAIYGRAAIGGIKNGARGKRSRQMSIFDDRFQRPCSAYKCFERPISVGGPVSNALYNRIPGGEPRERRCKHTNKMRYSARMPSSNFKALLCQKLTGSSFLVTSAAEYEFNHPPP
jgi:hypothetical protein